MNLTPQDLAREVASTGFGGDALERALRLLALLDALGSHVFHFDLPRLSVDVDLNYVGASGRETMLEERTKIERAVEAVCSREELTVRRTPSEHAGGKWRLTYGASTGGRGNLELDLNFLLRTPLWPVRTLECHPLGSFKTARIAVLDPHELAAGKLAALLARSASRDIFDAHRLLAAGALDASRLRLGFVVYGGINRKDWRVVSPADVKGEPEEAARELVPMLRREVAPTRGGVATWFEKLLSECRERLGVVLPLRDHEQAFLERLNGSGEIAPELLTSDGIMQRIIRDHPGLQWKALNVRRRRGVVSDGGGAAEEA